MKHTQREREDWWRARGTRGTLIPTTDVGVCHEDGCVSATLSRTTWQSTVIWAVVIFDADDDVFRKEFGDEDRARSFLLRLPVILTRDFLIVHEFKG